VSSGPTAIIQDDTVNPWNYGNFKQMVNAGEAMAANQESLQTTMTTASVEVAGLPEHGLAEEMGQNSRISDISVQFGITGVTTKYRFKTYFGHEFGLGKDRIDQISVMNGEIRGIRKDVVKLDKLIEELRLQAKENEAAIKDPNLFDPDMYTAIWGADPNNPSGTTQTHGSIDIKQSTAVRSILENAVDPNLYQNTHYCHTDNLFLPFTTNVNDTHTPKFESPDPAAEITNEDLNPWGGNGVGQGGVPYGSIAQPTKTDYTNNFDSTDVRSIGLRTPIIAVGWGYDTNDLPVPNENNASPTEKFIGGTDHGADVDPKDYVAAPIDLRYDHDRGVWKTAGDGTFPVYIKRIGGMKGDAVTKTNYTYDCWSLGGKKLTDTSGPIEPLSGRPTVGPTEITTMLSAAGITFQDENGNTQSPDGYGLGFNSSKGSALGAGPFVLFDAAEELEAGECDT
jgi:hypothetical protein